MSRLRLSLAVLAAAAALPLAAAADLLVTRDGAQVETRGPWTVDGRRVIFHLPNGTLSSIRTDEIDLDASELATARAAEAAAQRAAPPAPRAPLGEPVLRLTEKELPPVGESGEAEGEGSGAAGEGTAANAVPLEVVSWEKVEMRDGDGVEVFGTLRNTSTNTVVSPGLTAAVYGEEGGLLATSDAAVNVTSIAAGRSANFRAAFPGLPDFAAIKFNVTGRGYQGQAADTSRPAAAAGEDVADEGGEPAPEEPYEEPPAADDEPPDAGDEAADSPIA